MPVVLSIAGSDPSGGAGIQGDLKTFQAHGVFGAAAITALSVQDTRGVRAFEAVAPELVAAQVRAVLEDLDVRAAKTGMLADAGVARAVARVLAERRPPALVVDPVLVATSGDALAAEGVLSVLREELLPLATVVTPNTDEAAALCGFPVESVEDLRRAARELVALGAGAALVTGAHLAGTEAVVDVLFDGAREHAFEHPRVPDARGFHGTGCALSAAIAARLALGAELTVAVERARAYVRAAIAGAVPRGGGAVPVDPVAGAETIGRG